MRLRVVHGAEVATNIGKKAEANGYGKTFTSGEGPSLFKANDGDVNGYQYYLFADQPSYHQRSNHYVPMATEDIASGQWTVIGNKMPEVNFPTNSDGGKPRHGCAARDPRPVPEGAGGIRPGCGCEVR